MFILNRIVCAVFCLCLPQISFAAKVSLEQIRRDVPEVLREMSKSNEGKNADYIPALDESHVNPNLFGIAIAKIDGTILNWGDSKTQFSIQSIAKPFTYALALKESSQEKLISTVGLNATGMPFNSMLAIELRSDDRRQNPMVNAGALQVVSLIQGSSKDEKWKRIHSFMNDAAGTTLLMSDEIFRSEMNTFVGNHSLALRLKKYNMLQGNIDETLENYTKECSLLVTAEKLATMGATLANWGTHPVTGKRVMDSEIAKNVLSVMVTAGLYENSGQWFTITGLPSKSGVSGAILTIVPGEMAIAVFSPRLDQAGNSIRAQAVIQELSKRWRLHLLGKPDSL